MPLDRKPEFAGVRPQPVLALALLIFLLSWARGAAAGELIRSDVAYHRGAYSIEIAMDIRGDINKIRAILLDYNQTPRYNNNITESELLGITDSGIRIGRVVIHDCLLSICRDLIQIQEMDKLPTGGIRIHVLPDKSDYRTADYLWRFIPRPKGITRLLVNAIIAPRISVPPLIGPWLIARKLKQRLIGVINRLEQLSQRDIKP